mgnify:CR=1 FL=1
MEKRDELKKIYAPGEDPKTAQRSAASHTKTDWQQQKEEQARRRKRENDLKKVEAEI